HAENSYTSLSKFVPTTAKSLGHNSCTTAKLVVLRVMPSLVPPVNLYEKYRLLILGVFIYYTILSVLPLILLELGAPSTNAAIVEASDVCPFSILNSGICPPPTS